MLTIAIPDVESLAVCFLHPEDDGSSTSSDDENVPTATATATVSEAATADDCCDVCLVVDGQSYATISNYSDNSKKLQNKTETNYDLSSMFLRCQSVTWSRVVLSRVVSPHNFDGLAMSFLAFSASPKLCY